VQWKSTSVSVIPAHAGIQAFLYLNPELKTWMPAFAGMTSPHFAQSTNGLNDSNHWNVGTDFAGIRSDRFNVWNDWNSDGNKVEPPPYTAPAAATSVDGAPLPTISPPRCRSRQRSK
jgi:hypothetical protein